MMTMTEYVVVTRPFYRETPPDYEHVFAKDEKEAHDMAFKDPSVKETIIAIPADKFEWNEEIEEKYWKMYR